MSAQLIAASAGYLWVAFQAITKGRGVGEAIAGACLVMLVLWVGHVWFTGLVHARFTLELEGMRLGFRRQLRRYSDVERVEARGDEVLVVFKGRRRATVVVGEVTNADEIARFLWLQSQRLEAGGSRGATPDAPPGGDASPASATHEAPGRRIGGSQ
jgi:hypothetical protein